MRPPTAAGRRFRKFQGGNERPAQTATPSVTMQMPIPPTGIPALLPQRRRCAVSIRHCRGPARPPARTAPVRRTGRAAHTDSGTIRMSRSGMRASTVRSAGFSIADSTTMTVSGAPWRSRNTRNECSPSSTHRPVLARSRDEATRRIACLTRGLSADVMRGTAYCAAYENPRHRRMTAIHPAGHMTLIDAVARRGFSGVVRKMVSTRRPRAVGRILRPVEAFPARTVRAPRPPRIPA